MSLKAFHVLFISCAVLLAFGFGAWCLRVHGPGESGWLLALGWLSFATGAGLVGYAVYFLRKMKEWSAS